MDSVQDTSEELDPRIRRTRQLLHDALVKLMKQKDFDRISIQDIAEASTLNRATFYAHFPDKFALLASVVNARFRELITKRGIRFDGCEGALRRTALGVCDYLAEMPGSSTCKDSSQQRYTESAIVDVVRAIILQGLGHHPSAQGLPAELVASTVAWAIYGAAQEWVRSPQRCSAEEMAVSIETLVTPIFGAATPVQ